MTNAARQNVPFVSVVIPTYNRRASLAQTLGGVLFQTVPDDSYEVIVVDDASPDDTRLCVEDLQQTASNLRYIRHEVNHGRSRTRNDGIEAASGEIIILLDDDNLPDPGFIAAHRRRHMEAGEHPIAVMGNACYAAEVVDGNAGAFLQSRYLGQRSAKDRAALDYSNLPGRCLWTLNCSFRRADLLSVGMFDTRYRFHGGEDMDLGFRLKAAGVRIVYCDDARSFHYDDTSLLRYKAKSLELAEGGARILDPACLGDTKVVYLVPIDMRRDSLVRIAGKLFAKALCSPPIRKLMESWALLIDGEPRLYTGNLYHYLRAAWLYQGFRSNSRTVRVNYGDDLATQL